MAESLLLELPDVAAPFSWHDRTGVPLLEASLPGARAAFSTRHGGVSDGAYRSLNLGILTDDDPARVRRNRALLMRALGREEESIAMGHQVHGADVEVRDPADSRRGTRLRKADGQATRSPALTPLVLVADCVPLVLGGAGTVAAVHCGWRGILAGVVDRALATLRELDPGGEVGAAVGPGIGACCYEVGEEVRSAFERAGYGDCVVAADRLDLACAVRAALERGGIARERIATAGLCTSCHPEVFFSHRRDGGVTGRQGGLGWLDR
jgi:polyphenol oxidase